MKGLFATKHGFHIHQYGDIRGEDGTSTGGHFGNPKGNPVKHGFPTNSHRHWGDLGNLHVRAGTSTYNRVDRVINVRGIVGRAITIHAEGDKGPMSQPSGGAGARIGYCVIGYANPGL